jgi:hypothetical protein
VGSSGANCGRTNGLERSVSSSVVVS